MNVLGYIKAGEDGRDIAGAVIRSYSLMDGIREDIHGLPIGELAVFSRETPKAR